MQASCRVLTAEELVRNVQSKLVKAGLDCSKYQRQLKDIASLFEPERSKVVLITEGPRAGAWEMFCYFKGIRHCFHSAREVAATFGIPVVRIDGPKRKREEEDAPRTEPRLQDGADDVYNKLIKSEPSKKKSAALKKSGRMGSRFQNQKLVKAINAHVGMEVVCGNLRARLVSANLGGMTFELLDENNKPSGDMVPPSQLAKRSCLAHQNNAWKSIKVDGITLDAWVCRLQEDIEAEDGGTDGALHAAMFMQRVDEMRGPLDDDDEYNSGVESDPQRSYSGGSPSKGLKLLSGAALQRIRHNGQQAESGHDAPLPIQLQRGSSLRDDNARLVQSSTDGKDVEGMFSNNAPAAEALLQLQKSSMGDDPVVLQQQLHEVHQSITNLNEENKQLRAMKDKLEQLLAQKNHEIAESMKAVIDTRREAKSCIDSANESKTLLEQQLAVERSARMEAERQLTEMNQIQTGNKAVKLSVTVVDASGNTFEPRMAQRLAELEAREANTIDGLRLMLKALTQRFRSPEDETGAVSQGCEH